MKKGVYCFVGKVKDLVEDIECEIDNIVDREIQQGFAENGLCDTYGYCSSSCKYYGKCKGI